MAPLSTLGRYRLHGWIAAVVFLAPGLVACVHPVAPTTSYAFPQASGGGGMLIRASRTEPSLNMEFASRGNTTVPPAYGFDGVMLIPVGSLPLEIGGCAGAGCGAELAVSLPIWGPSPTLSTHWILITGLFQVGTQVSLTWQPRAGPISVAVSPVVSFGEEIHAADAVLSDGTTELAIDAPLAHLSEQTIRAGLPIEIEVRIGSFFVGAGAATYYRKSAGDPWYALVGPGEPDEVVLRGRGMPWRAWIDFGFTPDWSVRTSDLDP